MSSPTFHVERRTILKANDIFDRTHAERLSGLDILNDIDISLQHDDFDMDQGLMLRTVRNLIIYANGDIIYIITGDQLSILHAKKQSIVDQFNEIILTLAGSNILIEVTFKKMDLKLICLAVEKNLRITIEAFEKMSLLPPDLNNLVLSFLKISPEGSVKLLDEKKYSFNVSANHKSYGEMSQYQIGEYVRSKDEKPTKISMYDPARLTRSMHDFGHVMNLRDIKYVEKISHIDIIFSETIETNDLLIDEKIKITLHDTTNKQYYVTKNGHVYTVVFKKPSRRFGVAPSLHITWANQQDKYIHIHPCRRMILMYSSGDCAIF